MKRRHIAMMLAMAASIWLAFFHFPELDIDVVEAVDKSPPAVITVPQDIVTNRIGSVPSKTIDEPFILALHDREALIKRDGSNAGIKTLFGSHNWTPPSPLPVMAAPTLPTAPPLPFKYLGKSRETDQWQVFLAHDNTTLIVKENDVIDNVYRVQTITPPSMTLLYLPLSETQSLTIE